MAIRPSPARDTTGPPRPSVVVSMAPILGAAFMRPEPPQSRHPPRPSPQGNALGLDLDDPGFHHSAAGGGHQRRAVALGRGSRRGLRTVPSADCGCWGVSASLEVNVNIIEVP